jgi:hypothetical protein
MSLNFAPSGKKFENSLKNILGLVSGLITILQIKS